MKSNLLCVVAILVVGRVYSFSNPTSLVSHGQRGRVSGTPVRTVIIKSDGNVSCSCTSTTSTALAVSFPSWGYYSIGHIVGGCTGSPLVARATKSWYRRISLPTWTPPNYAFAPVWTTLYGLMGYSISRIVKSTSPTANVATKFWTLHYALNLFWAPVFFGFQYLRLGLIINLLLIATLGMILPLYHQIDPLSAYLQIPYLMWLIFATKLNQSICKLNPMVGGSNEAMIQADLCASGEGYNDAMLQYDIKKLQVAAAKYAGL